VFSIVFMMLAGWMWIFISISVAAQDVTHQNNYFYASIDESTANKWLIF